MGELPVGWCYVKLNDISMIVTGKTPSKKQPENFGTEIPFIKPGDVYNQGFIKNTSEKLSVEGANKVPTIPENSIAVTCIGNLGRVGITTVQSASNQQINSVVPFDQIYTKYLYYYLMTLKPWMEKEASSTTVTIINKGRFSSAPVLLPPLNEQICIANKLDSLLAKVEAAQTRLDKIPTLLKRFRQAVLAAATSGELTKEWRDGRTLDKDTRKLILLSRRKKWEEFALNRLIDNGKQPKNEKWKLRYKEPAELISSQCFGLPNSWVWSNVNELTWQIKDGPHFSPKYSVAGIPFISGGNVRPTGIDFSKTKFISEELHTEFSKRCKPEIGDILYTKGGTTGIAYFNQENRKFNVWVHVAVLKLVDGISGQYLQNALNSKHCYDQSQKYTRGVGNQDLGLTRMIHITVPLPPIEEQKQIVKQVESLFILAEKVEKQYQQARKRTDKLTQSLLAKAFKGELVPQDPNDEPAEKLLARIQAEREKLKPAKKPGGRGFSRDFS